MSRVLITKFHARKPCCLWVLIIGAGRVARAALSNHELAAIYCLWSEFSHLRLIMIFIGLGAPSSTVFLSWVVKSLRVLRDGQKWVGWSASELVVVFTLFLSGRRRHLCCFVSEFNSWEWDMSVAVLWFQVTILDLVQVQIFRWTGWAGNWWCGSLQCVAGSLGRDLLAGFCGGGCWRIDRWGKGSFKWVVETGVDTLVTVVMKRCFADSFWTI